MAPDQYKYNMAVQDFLAARQKAAVQEVLGRITGKSTQLLSYEDVAEKLNLNVRTDRGVQSIPLDAIVGSVGRYTDFTRTFLPRRPGGRERWARVKTAADEGAGLPPIEVYKVGEAYFVIDGNHRVSVARQTGQPTIEARVIEVRTDVPLTPDVQPDDMIIKAEYSEFLERTRINDLRPNVDLAVSIPGQYNNLMSQIYLHKFLTEENSGTEITLEEAVTGWYDNIYIPVAEIIRDRGLLRWFPKRTVTDLYIWISENRRTLEKELDVEIQSDLTATDLIVERRARAETGEWRKARIMNRYTDKLFADILVPLSGADESWDALAQAIIVAQREKARLHGLHVVKSRAAVEGEAARTVQGRFNETCSAAGVDGKLIIERGNVTDKILKRAVLTDLIVMKILHPPSGGLSTLASSIRSLIVSSSRPLLVVPSSARPLKRILLAFDGSPRAREALFVATYIAEAWGSEMIVWSMLETPRVQGNVQDHVRRYLEFHELEADYVLVEKSTGPTVLDLAGQRDVDLVLMGGYGTSLVREVVVGSYLDVVLRNSRIPTFISR